MRRKEELQERTAKKKKREWTARADSKNKHQARVAKKNSKNGHTEKEQTEGTSKIAQHKNNTIN
jgi:hypothetical protein